MSGSEQQIQQLNNWINRSRGYQVSSSVLEAAIVEADDETATLLHLTRWAEVALLIYETEQLVEVAIAAGFSLPGSGISVAGFIDPDHK